MLKAVLISAAVGLIKPTLPADLALLQTAFFRTFPFPFIAAPAVEAATLLSSAMSLIFVVPVPCFCLRLAFLDPAAFWTA